MKKNSWHYQCAKIANDNCNIRDGEMSICQYTRKVIWGMLLLTTVLVVLVGFIAVYCVGAYQIVGYMFGFSVFGAPAFITAIVTGLILMGALHILFVDYTENTRKTLMRKDNSTFIAKAYRSYKEKVCYPIEFEDDK